MRWPRRDLGTGVNLALWNLSVQRTAVVEHADRGGRNPVGTMHWVWSVEQVTERAPVMRVHPASTTMFGAVVNHVAALAECGQLVKRAVAGIMVEVSTGQYHRCPPALDQDILHRSSHAPSPAIAPA